MGSEIHSFIGASVLVTSQDDVSYTGFIHAIDIEASTIFLDKVTCTRENPTNINARGQVPFLASDIKDLQVLKLSNEPSPKPYHESFLGHFVSVMTKEDVRVEGLLAHLNLEEERLIVENAYCYGTEGRKKRRRSEIAACNKLVLPVVFRFKHLKDLELIFIPNTQRGDDQSVFPSLTRQHVQH